MPFYGLPFFYGDMRKITVTVVLCAILGVNFFFSCQSVVENAKQPDAALITQTKDSVEAGLSKDFCRLSLVFQDVEGKLIKNSLDILPVLWENVVSEVPIRVVKEGAELSTMQGNGW